MTHPGTPRRAQALASPVATRLQVTDARTADVGRIVTVFRAARTAALPWLPARHSSSEDLEFLGRTVEARTACVAVLDDSMVGLAVTDPHEHMLEHLSLDPALRRHGIGSALVRHARSRHLGPLELWCRTVHHAAHAFHAACAGVNPTRPTAAPTRSARLTCASDCPPGATRPVMTRGSQ